MLEKIMKNIILLLALSLVAKVSFAKAVHPSIDDDLDYRYESEVKEGLRGVAAAPEPARPDDRKEPEVEKENMDREVASDEEVFNSTNENGIKYWKY
jgi:hypothetical protein